MNPYQYGGGHGTMGGAGGAPGSGVPGAGGPSFAAGPYAAVPPHGQAGVQAVAGVSVSPSTGGLAADVLVQYGGDVSDFAKNLARIDPYITTEVCKDILQKKFPGLTNSALLAGATFQNLMMYYKVHHQVDHVPADVTVVLSTMAEALASIDLANRSKLQMERKMAEAAAAAEKEARREARLQQSLAAQPVQRGRGRPRGRGRGRGRAEWPQAPVYQHSGTFGEELVGSDQYIGMEADLVGRPPNVDETMAAVDGRPEGPDSGGSLDHVPGGGEAGMHGDAEDRDGTLGRKRTRKPGATDRTKGQMLGDDLAVSQTKFGERVIRVLCNGKMGFYKLDKHTLDCMCDVCEEIKRIMELDELDMSPREFEYHAGMAHCKRWRSTIFVYNPNFKGNRGKTLGNWLDIYEPNDALNGVKVRGMHDYLVRTYAVPAGRGWGAKFLDQSWTGLALEKEYNDRRQMRVAQNGGKVAQFIPMNGYAHTPDYPRSHGGHLHPGPMHDAVAMDMDERAGISGPRGAGISANGAKRGGKRGPGRPRNPELFAERQQAVAEAIQAQMQPVITSFDVINDSMSLSVKILFGRARFSGTVDLVAARKTLDKGSADPVLALKLESAGGSAASPARGTAPTSGTISPEDGSPSPSPSPAPTGLGGNGINASGHERETETPDDPGLVGVSDAPTAGGQQLNSFQPVDEKHPASGADLTGIGAPAPQNTDLGPNTHLPDAVSPALNQAALAPPTIPAEQGPPKSTYVPPEARTYRKKQWGKTPEQKEAEFNKLTAEGPQAHDTCAFCGLPGQEKVDPLTMGFLGRADHGLGELILIKVNKGNHAWVHDQCARWAPEVHDPTGEGMLAGVGTACLRGRRIRCKKCGNKGATMGCFSKNCKHSWHLPCARDECIINKDPYFVVCQQHRHEFGL